MIRSSVLLSLLLIAALFLGIGFNQRVFSQLENTFTNEKCGVSIRYPADWMATDSQFVFEDKAKTLVDFQSPDDDIFSLSLGIENFGMAKKSPDKISQFEREMVTLSPDASILESDVGQIGGFPSYKIAYVEGSPDKYEYQKDKFHTMEILVIAFDKEYRMIFQASDQAEYDKYKSIVEEMTQSLQISQPNYQGISC